VASNNLDLAMVLLEHLKAGHRLLIPTKCPQPIYAIMEKCWQFELNARPTFEEILKEIRQYSQNLTM